MFGQSVCEIERKSQSQTVKSSLILGTPACKTLLIQYIMHRGVGNGNGHLSRQSPTTRTSFTKIPSPMVLAFFRSLLPHPTRLLYCCLLATDQESTATACTEQSIDLSSQISRTRLEGDLCPPPFPQHHQR